MIDGTNVLRINAKVALLALNVLTTDELVHDANHQQAMTGIGVR